MHCDRVGMKCVVNQSFVPQRWMLISSDRMARKVWENEGEKNVSPDDVYPM